MLMPKAPGVYTREVDSGVRAVTGGASAVALFVGPTRSGIDARPQRIASFADFERLYGGLSQTSSLSYSVLHYFANGGGEAYVSRVPPAGATRAQTTLKQMGAPDAAIALAALSSGASGADVMIEIDSFDVDPTPLDKPTHFNLRLTHRATGVSERFGSLSTSATSARKASDVVSDPDTGSRLVSLDLKGADKPAPGPTGTIVKFKNFDKAALARKVVLKAKVSARDKAGTVSDDASLDLPALVVFEKDAAAPTRLDLVKRTVAALNQAIRAKPDLVAKMQGLAIEGELVGAGDYARFRVGAPGAGVLAGRAHDATIVFDKSPAAPDADDWIDAFCEGEPKAAPSRYMLGAAYKDSDVIAAAPGQDWKEGEQAKADGQPDSAAFKAAVSALYDVDPFFTLLCLPDAVRASAADALAARHENYLDIYAEAARACERHNAFLIVDLPPKAQSAGAALAWRQKDLTFRSSHAGAWFPNIRVDDPLQPGAIRAHPPSGAVAGIIARADADVGVWQAPAGTEAFLASVYGPAIPITEDDQAQLNPAGVNCIRRFPIYGTVSYGSRTLEGADVLASDWKYVPVRRTSSYILRTLKESLRWAVHKPNGEALWSQLRINVAGFMHDLFRQGAFKGISPRDAYFVHCDGTTTQPDDIDRGVVNIQIGFAPLKPAEFVIVTLRQIVQPAA